MASKKLAKNFIKYRNVVEIEAYQLSAGTREAIKSALGNFAWHSDSNGDEELYLYAEGGIRTECAREGDWIINHPLLGLSVMGADGEFGRPIFKSTAARW